MIVDETSPLAKTVSGRIEMANDFLDKDLITSAKQYINVVKTGQLDAATEGSEHDMLNVRAENEALRNGKPVTVLMTDLHGEHINEHRSILSSPEARENPELVMATLEHITSHITEWRRCDPAILFITGQQPPPPPAMPMGMAPPQGAPGQAPPGAPAGPTPGPGDSSKIQARQNPTESELPGQPNMPTLPGGAPDEAEQAYGKVA